MIYITAKLVTKKYGELYRAYETDTSSRFSIDERELKQLLGLNPTIVRNMALIGDKLEESSWLKAIQPFIEPSNWTSTIDPCLTKSNEKIKYILLCRIDTDRFKLLGTNQHIVFVDTKQLIDYTKEKLIYNCTIEKDGKLKAVDYYMAMEDEQFKEQIAKKYERFDSISNMLGKDMEFYYHIEGNNAEIISYSGTETSVTIPKFITSISGSCFVGCGIKEIILEEGLETIGSSAFTDCVISKITIPKTVQFMGLNVFGGCKRLLTKDGEYKEDRIIILNKQTIVLDKIIKDKERHRGI